MAMPDLHEFKDPALSKLASYSNWSGRCSPIVLANKGFSYTGKEYLITCDDCKATVNIETADIVSLSDKHERSCKIRGCLQKVTGAPVKSSRQEERLALSSSPQNNSSNPLYTSIFDINGASCWCPCSKCEKVIDLSSIRCRSFDIYGFSVYSDKQLLLTLKQKMEHQNGPMHREYETEEARRRSFMSNIEDTKNISDQVEAGFFCSDIGRECFYCGLTLQSELLVVEPWTEHARWFPVCPYVKQQKQEDFIHGVIKETKRLKNDLLYRNRPKNMNLGVVMDALKTYPKCVVEDTIQKFFLAYGSFPELRELFHIVESIKCWKTSETYDYCRK